MTLITTCDSISDSMLSSRVRRAAVSIISAGYTLKAATHAFYSGFMSKGSEQKQEQFDKSLREDLAEKQIDKTIEDSFPASDPPSTY